MSQLGMVKMMLETGLNPGSLKANSRGFQISWPQIIAVSTELKKKNPANLPVLPAAPCASCIVPPQEFRIKEQKLTSSGPSLHSSLTQDGAPVSPTQLPARLPTELFGACQLETALENRAS